MMMNLKELLGKPIEARDGSIGAVHDLFFSDESWRIRYFVVDTSKWLPSRKVLISPGALSHPWKEGHGLRVDITRDQVKSSPDIDTARPISQEAESILFAHYGWAPYWASGLMPPPPPKAAASLEEKQEAATLAESAPGAHLRSSRELMGYTFAARDSAEVGVLLDLLVDPESATVPYLVVRTGEGFARKTVVIPVHLVSEIDWAQSRILTGMSMDEVVHSAEYDVGAYV